MVTLKSAAVTDAPFDEIWDFTSYCYYCFQLHQNSLKIAEMTVCSITIITQTKAIVNQSTPELQTNFQTHFLLTKRCDQLDTTIANCSHHGWKKFQVLPSSSSVALSVPLLFLDSSI